MADMKTTKALNAQAKAASKAHGINLAQCREILEQEHDERMKTKHTPKPIAGYALAKALRDDANDCQRPDRAQLMVSAADEIERLIEEIRNLEKRS